MREKKKTNKLDFNGGWTPGEASHHIGKKLKGQVVKSKKDYKRKPKHKKDDYDEFNPDRDFR